MECDYCSVTFPDRGEEDICYGVLSVKKDYYPWVCILCPSCVNVAEEALEEHQRRRHAAG